MGLIVCCLVVFVGVGWFVMCGMMFFFLLILVMMYKKKSLLVGGFFRYMLIWIRCDVWLLFFWCVWLLMLGLDFWGRFLYSLWWCGSDRVWMGF